MSSYVVTHYHPHNLPDAYVNMIYSKWMRSLRYGNDFFKLVNPADYYTAYQRYIAVLLNKPECLIWIASLYDDRDVVLGFAVTRESVLDYVWVHKHQRKLGIASKLVPEGIRTISHLTKTGLSIWGSKFSHWKFNPFA